jgi:cephalosporin-C deacetylase-like acetyl esterase
MKLFALVALLMLSSALVSVPTMSDDPMPQDWPKLPDTNATIAIPAQAWPLRPGRRTVNVLVHFPGGKLANVNAKTGVMLSLHNWGGENCVGTASPQALADRFNVIGVCVNYLQSGAKDSIEGPEPYDFGYLQALDALRALWWVKTNLQTQGIPFAEGRMFCTGGSGGGNVTLMANKLAPRTFACVIDLCGMKKLSHDIAFHLPGGSDLDARWSRDPAHPYFLSQDDQDLRFIGNPKHLAVMKKLGSACRMISVHGVDDTTCPTADAREMVDNMRSAGLDIDPRFIDKSQLDGKAFTSTGHALGDRTEIVFRVASEFLAPEGEKSLSRPGKSDFDLRDELVRYPTPGGEFVISYSEGYPIGRFDPAPTAISYSDHHDLTRYIDREGQSQPIKTADDWAIRRQHIVANLQRVMGRLPGESFRAPLDVKVLEEKREDGLLWRKISYQSDPFDRVTAWLLLPTKPAAGKRPAILALQQTTEAGKDEPVGKAGAANMHYGLELAKRGYVVLAPDYPSFGEHAYQFDSHPEFASGSAKAIWDNIRAVDLLSTLPEVDPQRIGVIGHSLGGHNAMFTAVFEPRLKVIVSSCGFSSMRKDDVPSWNGPRYMPHIATEFANDVNQLPFDFPEIVASFAPRPFLAVAATEDNDFDVAGVKEVMSAAAPIYRLLGHGSHLESEYPDSPHDFPPAARERAYQFLDKHLGNAPPK